MSESFSDRQANFRRLPPQEEEFKSGQDSSPEHQVVDFEARPSIPWLRLKNIHKTYLLGLQGVPALRGVSLEVMRGEMLCILGTSGGGKTTMLNLIGTIDTPTKGDLYLRGNRIKSSTKDSFLAALRLNEIGFVFQSFNLLPSLTALENVSLPMQLRGVLSRSQIGDRARKLLSSVGLEHRHSHFPNQLSGGEQQRVTIARAIANQPSLLLLGEMQIMIDEPTGDLDTKNADIVMKILTDLNMENKLTMVMVTHDVSNKYFCNRVVRISDGKIIGFQKIETPLRNNHLEKLNNRLSGEKDEDAVLEIREGVDLSNDTDSSKSKTSVRKPSDYPVLRRMLKQMGRL